MLNLNKYTSEAGSDERSTSTAWGLKRFSGRTFKVCARDADALLVRRLLAGSLSSVEALETALCFEGFCVRGQKRTVSSTVDSSSAAQSPISPWRAASRQPTVKGFFRDPEGLCASYAVLARLRAKAKRGLSAV
jgi:hypothetical protein